MLKTDMHQISQARDTSAKQIPPNSFSGLFVLFLFQLALLWSCLSEHQQLQSISSRQALWLIFPCVRVCVCACGVQQKEKWSERLNWREARKELGKGDKGGQLPEHNYCSNNLHPSPASSLGNGPIPTSGTGFPARSARRSVIPKRPLPALSGNPKRHSEQPSLPSRASSSSPSAPTHLQLQPPQVGGELALTPPLPHASGEVNKSPGTPSWPLSK